MLYSGFFDNPVINYLINITLIFAGSAQKLIAINLS